MSRFRSSAALVYIAGHGLLFWARAVCRGDFRQRDDHPAQRGWRLVTDDELAVLG
jgi:hypothetical protein